MLSIRREATVTALEETHCTVHNLNVSTLGSINVSTLGARCEGL